MDKDSFNAFFNGSVGFGAVGIENLSNPLRIGEGQREVPVAGYHVLATSPSFDDQSNIGYKMREYEQNTALLSALLWKQYNGPIRMITDPIGYRFLHDTSLFEVYEEVLPILEVRNSGISHKKYWASGKLQALRQIVAPCAIIDMDLLVWEPLQLTQHQVVAAHTEPIDKRIYPSLSYFHLGMDYAFPLGWKEDVEPINTSILYFSEEEFKRYYTTQSILFMQSEKETPDDGTICMVFAEQRILAMCAAEKRVSVHTLLDFEHLSEHQNIMTHIWSAKELLHCDRKIEEHYNFLCKEKIEKLTILGKGK